MRSGYLNFFTITYYFKALKAFLVKSEEVISKAPKAVAFRALAYTTQFDTMQRILAKRCIR